MKNIIKTALIENYIKENNLTTDEFCRLCQIDKGVIEKINKADYDFDAVCIFKICHILKIKPYQLFEDWKIED